MGLPLLIASAAVLLPWFACELTLLVALVTPGRLATAAGPPCLGAVRPAALLLVGRLSPPAFALSATVPTSFLAGVGRCLSALILRGLSPFVALLCPFVSLLTSRVALLALGATATAAGSTSLGTVLLATLLAATAFPAATTLVSLVPTSVSLALSAALGIASLIRSLSLRSAVLALASIARLPSIFPHPRLSLLLRRAVRIAGALSLLVVGLIRLSLVLVVVGLWSHRSGVGVDWVELRGAVAGSRWTRPLRSGGRVQRWESWVSGAPDRSFSVGGGWLVAAGELS